MNLILEVYYVDGVAKGGVRDLRYGVGYVDCKVVRGPNVPQKATYYDSVIQKD